MNVTSSKTLRVAACAAILLACIMWSAGGPADSAQARPSAQADARNLARGLTYALQPDPSVNYPDTGGMLTDGSYASAGDMGHGWVGFDQGRPEIMFDLGEVSRIDRVEASFLLAPEAGVSLPVSVQLLVSTNGERWSLGGRLAASADRPSVFGVDTSELHARYVRILIERNSWLFVDEIAVFGSAAPGAPAYEPIKKVLVISSMVDDYDETRSRLTNLLEGMGLPFDVVQHDNIPQTDLRNYQLVIVTAAAARELEIDQAGETQVIDAINDGVNFLWIGSGIWGTFETTALPEAFGLRYIEQGWSTEMGIAHARFTNLADEVEQMIVHKEIVSRVEAVEADVEEWYLGEDGQELAIPFITRYRATDHSGIAVYVSLPILDFWKAGEAEDTYARGEVLFKYIRRLTGQGTVGKHPVHDARDGVFLLRLEDHTPGGTAMGHAKRLWFVRLAMLVEMVRQNDVPLNIALVPRYAHPYRNEYHDWSEDELGIAIVRRLTHQMLADGGSLIVHGYYHQNGSGADDFSGDDWEMWDEDRRRFLSLAEQQRITDAAFAEVVAKWDLTPTIWETPHYISNADTFRAAYRTGFLYAVESDTKLFPNRDGYLNNVGGLMLNIPETGFDYPDTAEDIKASSILKQRYIMPRLVRMNGLFLMFYHNDSVMQYTALQNMLATVGRFDMWRPNVEEYAVFWEDRQRVEIDAQIDPIHRRIVANVARGFEGFALSIRLPDDTLPGPVTINGQVVQVAPEQVDGVWYVCPVLPDATCEVLVDYYTLDELSDGEAD